MEQPGETRSRILSHVSCPLFPLFRVFKRTYRRTYVLISRVRVFLRVLRRGLARYNSLSIVIVPRHEMKTFHAVAVAHLTFPPQNWHAEPCQPSWHTQVPLTQSPLTQLSVSQVVSAVSDDEEEEAAAVTCTTQQISATHSIGHGTAITPH